MIEFEGCVVEMNRKKGRYRTLGVSIPQYVVEAEGLKKGDKLVLAIK